MPEPITLLSDAEIIRMETHAFAIAAQDYSSARRARERGEKDLARMLFDSADEAQLYWEALNKERRRRGLTLP